MTVIFMAPGNCRYGPFDMGSEAVGRTKAQPQSSTAVPAMQK